MINFHQPQTDVFEWAERGINVIEAQTVTVSEAIWTAVNKDTIAGFTAETTPNTVLRGFGNDGPVRIALTDDQDFAVYRSLINHHTLYEALLSAGISK